MHRRGSFSRSAPSSGSVVATLVVAGQKQPAADEINEDDSQRCKTLIGSNEGSCTHDRWREGRQWYGEDRRAMGRRRLGLRKRTVTKCGSAGQSARQSAETDQRTEDREHGAGIGSDDISGRLLKVEWHQTA